MREDYARAPVGYPRPRAIVPATPGRSVGAWAIWFPYYAESLISAPFEGPLVGACFGGEVVGNAFWP